MAITIDGVAGLKALIGKDLGATDWQELTFEEIVRFADATGDHQWLHVDRERCLRESPYGAPIAHGYYSVSRIAALYLGLVKVEGCKAVVNYGLDKVRFPTPLRAGARYRLALALADVKDVQGGAEAHWRATIEVEGEPKPACVAAVIYRYLT